MKLRSILAGALALALSASLAFAQQGTSPLTPTKGGTNSAFVGFAGPAASIKTFTLPNSNSTLAALGTIQTWTAAQSFTDGTVILLGLTSGSSTLKASATGGGTATLFSGTDTIAGKALANGGTNGALTASNGGILWSDASQFQILAGTATARLPLVSGATATPAWGAFTLPASVTSGGIPFFSSTSVMGSSALLTANAIMLGGGAGVTPATLASLGTTATVLHGNGAGAPSFGSVVSADMNITTTSCTNQFLTAISATGTGTCTTDTLASAQHANQGTTATVLHGNGAGNPAFGAVALATEVSGTLPVANGGTGDTGTAWSAFTPSLSCGTATFTVNSARFKTMGKTVWFNIDYTISAIGTCTTTTTFTMPATSQAGGGFAGREMVSTGYGVNCGFSGSTATGTCSPANIATVAFAVNNRIALGGVFESQ